MPSNNLIEGWLLFEETQSLVIYHPLPGSMLALITALGYQVHSSPGAGTLSVTSQRFVNVL